MWICVGITLEACGMMKQDYGMPSQGVEEKGIVIVLAVNTHGIDEMSMLNMFAFHLSTPKHIS